MTTNHESIIDAYEMLARIRKSCVGITAGEHLFVRAILTKICKTPIITSNKLFEIWVVVLSKLMQVSRPVPVADCSGQ